jgi:hypothetical protein
MNLTAQGGLSVDLAANGGIRVGLAHEDWFGPGSPSLPVSMGEPVTVRDALGVASSVTVVDQHVRCSVRAYVDAPLIVFRCEATKDLSEIATGAFDRPAMAWPTFRPGERTSMLTPPNLRALVFQHCEFALPSNAGSALDGWFLLPHRPPTGWPLLLSREDGRSILVAPLNAFHEQIIGLNAGTLRCGWHGDLESVQEGFTTDLAFLAADSPRGALDAWGRMLLDAAGTVRPGRWPDAVGSRPSYWTDNGSAYWYKTEATQDVIGSIVAAVDDLRMKGVRIGAVQLDSWFYPHAELRPFNTEEWEVPPTAMVSWEERSDILPEGIAALRDGLGNPPLVAHIRHLSVDSPMADTAPTWRDPPYAAPSTPEAYERWLDQCVTWGVETLEHDWMVEVFFGVRGMRSRPGRATAWQEGIDAAARERGITLQWCMGTPADFAQTTALTQVTSVRTSGDHGYIATAGQLWAWFCITNALAGSLGLMPFKDVFRADPEVAGQNGEPEALLSALSTGPVGLGDRVGRMDPAIALRTCRADGLLVKPHNPITAIDESLLSGPAFNPVPLFASCTSEHEAGTWTYFVAFHANPADEPVTGEIRLTSLPSLPRARTQPGFGRAKRDCDVANHLVAWNWRTQNAERLSLDSAIPVSLEREDWDFYVLVPILSSGLAVIGDVTKFVTAGDARIEIFGTSSGARLVVKGGGEKVTIVGWAEAAPTSPDGVVHHDATTGVWTMTLKIPSRGWTSINVDAGNPSL